MFGFFDKKEIKAESKMESKIEKLRRLIVSDVERVCSETAVWELALLKKHFSDLENSFSRLEPNLANRFSNLDDRLSKLEEQSQQALRQEHRKQAVLESLLEDQQKILDVLERLQMSPPLEAMMALAENFALAYPAGSGTTEIDVLRGKLCDLMECFDLSLVMEAGVDFDPEKHEACGVDFNPAYPENAVLEVVTPGFLLKGKLLRCAVVVVNRRPGAEGEETKEPDAPEGSSE